MRGRVCPQCGDPLEESTYGSGSVWSCAAHGVKQWFFDDGDPGAVLRGPTTARFR